MKPVDGIPLVATDASLLVEVRRVADDVAAPLAATVDRDARFPREAIDALRDAGALSSAVPAALGGGGATLETIANACFELGRRCGATGMIYAMHQIQVLTIVRHAQDSAWFSDYLRELASEQRLIASATSEVGTGGDMSRSIAPITPTDSPDLLTFEKQATTVSYGAHADDLLTTVRRAPDAEQGDQALVLSCRGQAELEPTSTWDTLGMRGTCSPGFVVRARFAPEQILPTPFATAMSQSMVPLSHILWSNVWLGISTDAFERARAFVRAGARARPGETPRAAQRLSKVMADLALLRSHVVLGLQDFIAADCTEDRSDLMTMASVLRFNNLKLAASEHAPIVCAGALEAIGILGYKNDTEYSVGRHLRDVLSARLMVANERVHATNASLLLIAKDA